MYFFKFCKNLIIETDMTTKIKLIFNGCLFNNKDIAYSNIIIYEE